MSMFNPVQLIQEVKKRPGLYSADQPSDREEKLTLWKEIGAVIYHNWNDFNKATAYDKVLQLQRKWRSLRDAYNRELRSRKSGVRVNRRVYRYFKRMSFLGGFDGNISDDDDGDVDSNEIFIDGRNILEDEPTIIPVQVKKSRKKKRKRASSNESIPIPEEMEMSFPVEMAESETDSDRLFLLSFLPEMRQLPVHIKMWARAQIANVMQEAVTSHYSNTKPGATEKDVKRQRHDSTD